MICICGECVKSPKIKNMIYEIDDKQEGKCLVCGKIGIDIENEDAIAQEFANQIRYYYSAFEYIQGVANYPLSAYFPLIIKKNIFEKENFTFTNPINPEQAKKIMEWIYAKSNLNDLKMFDLLRSDKKLHELLSYTSHMKLPLKEASSALIESLKEDIKNKNYYEIEDKYRTELHTIVHMMSQISIIDKSFYRAREGFNKEDIVVDDMSTTINIPYIGKEVMSPPPYLASAGRFNRMGCAFLYVANERNTAVAELKPRVGAICSTIEVKCNDKRLYLDFRRDSIPSIDDDKSDCVVINVIASIVELILIPVKSEQEYVITQFLSDIFRKEGFGGIIYDSVQTEGYNVLAFYPSEYKFVKNSEKMMKVKKVQYILDDLQDGRDKYQKFDYVSDDVDEKYTR